MSRRRVHEAATVVVWSVFAVFVLASSGWAVTILPTDDVSYRGGTRYNNTSVYGLFTKGNGASDRGYMQFSADTTPVTSAILHLYNYWGTPQGKTVNFDVRVRGIGENEAGYLVWTELATPAPSGTSHESWAIQGDWHVDSTPAWYTVDVTAVYNANLGKKITFSVRALSGTGDGPIFEDKESTGTTGNAPYIELISGTPTCDSSVTPADTQTSTALRSSAADPPSHVFTINNVGTEGWLAGVNEYTVIEMQKTSPAIADLYSTGVDSSRVVLGDQTLDSHWMIIAGGLDGTCTQGAPCPTYTVPADGFPIPPWLENDSSSRWITASSTDADASAPPGDHTFRTTFTLSAGEVSTTVLHLKYALDDQLVDVLLNGVSLGISNSGSLFTTWQELVLDSGFQASTNTLDFVVHNGGIAANAMGLRVEFFDIVAGDVPWLSLDKSGGPVAAGVADMVSASIVDTDMSDGTYTGYLLFTDGCSPPKQHLRQIDLTVIDCRSEVSPATDTGRAVRLGSAQTPAPVVYTFQNTGAPSVSYTVASSAAWLQLDKSGSAAPIPSGGSDVVTGAVDPTGLAAGGHVATVTFTDTCNPAIQHVRQVLLSVDETINTPSGALQQFNAEFTTFTGSDATAQSPLESCDLNTLNNRTFVVHQGNDYINLPTGWLTQGSIAGTPTTADFYTPAGDGFTGRARFRGPIPFDNTYDPAKGMAVAWRMWVASTDAIVRGPIQITFPRAAGPFGEDQGTSAIPGEVFSAYIRVQNGADIRILGNSGGVYANVGQLTLPNSIADAFHQWTAGICYNSADQMAYWNLWLDGDKLLFGGTDGSVLGPGGDLFSFRTGLNDVTGDPYIGLGENAAGEDAWDFEFDWVRMLTYNVSGCPFWDGEGCIPVQPCNTPFADADDDGDVDMDDFAALQLCLNIGLASPPALVPEECRCFDRNNNKIVGDSVDLLNFVTCGSGKDVLWQSSVGCE